jgi:hypothetical protein
MTTTGLVATVMVVSSSSRTTTMPIVPLMQREGEEGREREEGKAKGNKWKDHHHQRIACGGNLLRYARRSLSLRHQSLGEERLRGEMRVVEIVVVEIVEVVARRTAKPLVVRRVRI